MPLVSYTVVSMLLELIIFTSVVAILAIII